jgi:hypothetical protein
MVPGGKRLDRYFISRISVAVTLTLLLSTGCMPGGTAPMFAGVDIILLYFDLQLPVDESAALIGDGSDTLATGATWRGIPIGPSAALNVLIEDETISFESESSIRELEAFYRQQLVLLEWGLFERLHSFEGTSKDAAEFMMLSRSVRRLGILPDYELFCMVFSSSSDQATTSVVISKDCIGARLYADMVTVRPWRAPLGVVWEAYTVGDLRLKAPKSWTLNSQVSDPAICQTEGVARCIATITYEDEYAQSSLAIMAMPHRWGTDPLALADEAFMALLDADPTLLPLIGQLIRLDDKTEAIRTMALAVDEAEQLKLVLTFHFLARGKFYTLRADLAGDAESVTYLFDVVNALVRTVAAQ